LLGRDLMKRQNTEFIGEQKQVRGFWMQGDVPYVNIPESAVPPLALLELHATFPDAPDRAKWLDAVKLHADEYLLPMAARNAYGVIPLVSRILNCFTNNQKACILRYASTPRPQAGPFGLGTQTTSEH